MFLLVPLAIALRRYYRGLSDSPLQIMLPYERIFLRLLFVAVGAISASTNLYGQHAVNPGCVNDTDPSANTPSEIAQGVFLRKSHHGQVFEQENLANIGFIIGDNCVAVIDTGGSPKEGNALHCAILKITDKSICYVINTHVHPDHILGNQSFESADIKIIGHKNLPRAMSMLGPTYAERLKEFTPDTEVRIQMPTASVETSMALDLGNRRLILTTYKNAHTDNDLTVFDEKTQTLWAGDLLFSDHLPILGGSGSVNGFIKSTEKLKQQAPAMVIPGHGPVADNVNTVANIQLQYLIELRDQVRKWIEDGGDIGPAVEKIGSRYDTLPMFEHFHKRNVSYAYTELEWE